MAGSKEVFGVVNGIKVPYFVVQEEVDKLKDLKLYPDDVWIATYPKSGTTWVQQIVRLIRNGGRPDDVKISVAVPWPEAGGKFPVNLDETPRPRTFKTHFDSKHLPCGPPDTTPCKYICVVRNPKDVAVSYYFLYKMGYIPDMEWSDFWKMYVGGEMMYGDYFDHLLTWLPYKDNKNVLFMTYEDMKRNLLQSISQIASFIEVELSRDVILKIADITTFDSMQKDVTVNYSWVPEFRNEKGESTFIRKGIVGDWKNFLTLEQSAEIDFLCSEKLKVTGFDFLFEL